MLRLLAGLLLATLAGCVGGPGLKPLMDERTSVEIAGVPFFAQEQFQCGPAALATVLSASGVAVTPGQLQPEVYVPGRKGSFQAELIAATRRHGRVPYVISPSLAGLAEQIRAGQPVLVFQNLGVSWYPVWHYAVVVGLDPVRDEVVLNSGTSERERLAAKTFDLTWARSGRWGMVTMPASQIPAGATPAGWLGAAAAFESLGQLPLASTAYAAAVARWPQEPLAWQAEANALYAAGDFPAAVTALRKAVQLDPSSVPARNNLAQALLDAGCPLQAKAEIEKALDAEAATPADAALRGQLHDTQAAILAHRGSGTQACP